MRTVSLRHLLHFSCPRSAISRTMTSILTNRHLFESSCWNSVPIHVISLSRSWYNFDAKHIGQMNGSSILKMRQARCHVFNGPLGDSVNLHLISASPVSKILQLRRMNLVQGMLDRSADADVNAVSRCWVRSKSNQQKHTCKSA